MSNQTTTATNTDTTPTPTASETTTGTTPATTTSTTDDGSTSRNAGAVAGLVIFSLALVAAFLGGAWWLHRCFFFNCFLQPAVNGVSFDRKRRGSQPYSQFDNVNLRFLRGGSGRSSTGGNSSLQLESRQSIEMQGVEGVISWWQRLEQLVRTGAALKPLSFHSGQVFAPVFTLSRWSSTRERERESEMCSLCTKSTNLKHVQEKEEEENRLLGGELGTQTSPSGQVTAPHLLIFVWPKNIQVPLTMIGVWGVKKMQDGLNGQQVIRNRVQAMHGWRLTRAMEAKK